MRYLAALLVTLLPFVVRADDMKPTHDELLIQATEKSPASATEYIAGIRRAIAAATHARLVVDVEAALLETYRIDEGTFLTLTDLGVLRELADQLEFDSSKLPHRDPQYPQNRVIRSACMCNPDYTVVLYRNNEIIAAIGFCHTTHTRAQDYSDRVVFPEISGGFDYNFTKAGSKKVRAWEEKYHIKELVKKHDAARTPAKG